MLHKRHQLRIITVLYWLQCRSHHHLGMDHREGQAWLRVVDDDVKPMNFGIDTAWPETADRE